MHDSMYLYAEMLVKGADGEAGGTATNMTAEVVLALDCGGGKRYDRSIAYRQINTGAGEQGLGRSS